MTITIQIEAENLEDAMYMLGKRTFQSVTTPVPTAEYPVLQFTKTTASSPAPVLPASSISVPASAQSAPILPPPPPAQSAPAAPPVAPPPPTVPTAPVAYTQDQLLRAAAPIMDAGKMAELQQLMASFGVSHMGELPPARYGEFANALRGLGAKL